MRSDTFDFRWYDLKVVIANSSMKSTKHASGYGGYWTGYSVSCGGIPKRNNQANTQFVTSAKTLKRFAYPRIAFLAQTGGGNKLFYVSIYLSPVGRDIHTQNNSDRNPVVNLFQNDLNFPTHLVKKQRTLHGMAPLQRPMSWHSVGRGRGMLQTFDLA